MASVWTALTDKANLAVITPTIWNEILGDEGNLQYVYERLTAAKYKTATQVFTTSTTFADITAASGNFAFDVAASGVYVARYVLPVSFGGSGGVKLQLTGPSAPTLVRADAFGETVKHTYGGSGSVTDTAQSQVFATRLGGGTAFSASLVAADSTGVVNQNGASATAAAGLLPAGTVIVLDVIVVNGANAGTVTLQGAQNSANSTTTFGAGCWMGLWRVA